MKAKNIIKEIIIVLLLILAVILILGILLYEYVPNNKIIPQQVSYTTPANVREELATSENVDDSQVIMTYEVTATDLTNYKKTKDYVSGKKNPFEAIDSKNTTSGSSVGSETAGNSTATTSNNTNGTSTNTTTDNTQDGYLPDKGTK